MTIITESDGYRLIINSKLASAERFERWLMEEVLPTIRKTGAYIAPEKTMEMLQAPVGVISMLETIKDLYEKNGRLTSKGLDCLQDVPMVFGNHRYHLQTAGHCVPLVIHSN